MAGELMLGDFFSDFSTNECDSIQSNQLWMPEIYETLDEQQINYDDMLESIPEEIKTKLDTPLCDILKTESVEDDFLVGGEIEISESVPLGSALYDTTNSDESSGYASCVQSSNDCSPNKVRINESSHPSKLRIISTSDASSFIANSPYKIQVTRINPPKNVTATVQAVFQKSIKPKDNESSRVHYILRPFSSKTSSKSVSLDEIDLENKTSEKLSCLNEESCLQSPKCFYKFMQTNKPVKKETLYDRNSVMQSITSIGSQSSSESESKDIFDDDMAFQDHFYDHENTNESSINQMGFEMSLLNHQNLINHSKNIGTTKGFAKLSDNDPLFYDDGSSSDYSQPTKISHQRFFHDQMYSRIRGSTRIGQSDVNHPHMLVLTEEEKRTLIAEGYSIPTRLPLSKQDERNLKKVRRKIKNKISAQESRRKKKEYLEALERKVSIYSQENTDLKRRVDGLESTNRSLLGQLRLLQQLVSKSKSNSASSSLNSIDSNKTGNHLITSSNGDCVSRITHSNGSPSTCLMVFALCFAALLIGQPSGNSSQSTLNSGLSFTLSSQNSLNFWISQVPQRLASGSLSQIGYAFSKQPQFNEYKQNPNNFFMKNPFDSHSVVYDSSQEQMSKLDSQSPLHISSATAKSHVQRSRLLGEASELEDCATVHSFWSYLFGNPISNKNQICDRNGDASLTELQLLDDIEKDLMFTSLSNSTDSEYYSRFNENSSSIHLNWSPVTESF
uniref:cAMP responsive element binding protein 3-like 2 n=1 Tax=Schistosoma japonicum TaxID=6182 RepID=C7TXU5_SCHJA|nr:cAMP responsive element binding protein 3-like 2 [Schistosoma japonicum]